MAVPWSSASIEPLLVGRERSTTWRALLLAAGLFLLSGGMNVVALSFPDEALFLAEVNMAIFDFSAFRTLFDVGGGVILIGGLALIHAYLNEGLFPSLILATTPYYASYLFTVTGPRTGVVLTINDDLVVAPVWAAIHVFPNALLYGTLGFLTGLGARSLKQRESTFPGPEAN